MPRVDARLREMQFLARLDRDVSLPYQEQYTGTPEPQMIASLLEQGYLNDSFELAARDAAGYLPGAMQAIQGRHAISMGLFLAGRPITLTISHKGRVRLSELEQQLRTGRDRDETGLLWAKRHLDTDLAISLLSASNETPLSVVFLDMNGLKAINDTHGHAAGDDAIRAFFQAVISTLGQHGEAYRNGGDEVVVILPGTTDERAGTLLDAFVRQLGKEGLRLSDGTTELTLTASCGSASTVNPAEEAKALLKRADDVQYGAKEKSKAHTPRVSAFAVADGEVRIHAPGAAPRPT